MRNGKWSLQEDAILINYIGKHGVGSSWQSLANNSGLNRCGRSCRSRWLNYLRPGLKTGGFTEEEDRIISSLYNQKGRCWSVIAAQLPGRTDLSVKNYWNCKLSKKVASSKNKTLSIALRSKPDRRRPSAPITPPSTETQNFSRKPSTSDGLGSKLDTDESAQKTKLLTSSGSGDQLICEYSSSTNVASENLVADASASALVMNTECRPPEFSELVDWFVMSPPRDPAVDYSYFSSIIDGLEDIGSSDMLLSDEPWW